MTSKKSPKSEVGKTLDSVWWIMAGTKKQLTDNPSAPPATTASSSTSSPREGLKTRCAMAIPIKCIGTGLGHDGAPAGRWKGRRTGERVLLHQFHWSDQKHRDESAPMFSFTGRIP